MITNGIDVNRSRKVYLWIYLCSKYTIYMGRYTVSGSGGDCKSLVLDSGGSTPSPPTKKYGGLPKWLKGPVLKTGRSCERRLGSNPRPSAIKKIMSKIKYRKARPQPPRYYWWDTDCCWACKDRNNCNGCKRLKQYIANTRHNRRAEKQKLKKYPGVAE